MTERHRRAQARQMLSKAGYKSGGHFKPDGSAAKKLIGEAIREHESHDHPGKPKTKLKLKDGGTVTSAAFGARVRKPRGAIKAPKAPKTTVNVLVAHHPQPSMPPLPSPMPNAGPPPVGPGAPMPPGGLPGQMPGMANRGGRFKKGGAVKIDSQRDPIESTAGKVEGKLKRGGKSPNKFDYGGMVAPNASMGNPVMRVNPVPPPGVGGAPNPVMQIGAPGAPPPNLGPAAGMNIMRRGMPGSPLKKGGKAKTKDIIDGGAGGGLGRLEKAEAYGAKV